jgi:hypothetical protein
MLYFQVLSNLHWTKPHVQIIQTLESESFWVELEVCDSSCTMSSNFDTGLQTVRKFTVPCHMEIFFITFFLFIYLCWTSASVNSHLFVYVFSVAASFDWKLL